MGGVPPAATVLDVALVLATVPVLLLLASGPALLHPHARRGPNLVALVAGIVLGVALPLVRRVGTDARGTVVGAVAGVALLLAAQVGLVLVVLLLGWARLTWSARHRPPRQAAALVVLGAGLVGTQVTVVLAARLLAAIRLHGSLAPGGGRQTLPTERHTAADRDGRPPKRDMAETDGGRRVPVVVSGGQGPDEVTSEAAAMAAFLIDHGFDPAAILLEERSTSTRENLVHSAALVAEQAPDEADGPDGTPGRLVVVTNGFHVFRTQVLAHALRLDVVVVGCPTPPHYLPRALVRELVATLTLHPRRQLATAVLLVALGTWVGLT